MVGPPTTGAGVGVGAGVGAGVGVGFGVGVGVGVGVGAGAGVGVGAGAGAGLAQAGSSSAASRTKVTTKIIQCLLFIFPPLISDSPPNNCLFAMFSRLLFMDLVKMILTVLNYFFKHIIIFDFCQ